MYHTRILKLRKVIALVMFLVFSAVTSALAGEPASGRSEGRALTLDGHSLAAALHDSSRWATLAGGQAPSRPSRGPNHVMLWGGIALAAFGGLLAVADSEPRTDAACSRLGEDGPDMVTLLGGDTRLALEGECDLKRHWSGTFWTGIGIAALGSTFAVLGASVSVQPGRIRISRVFSF